METTTHEEYHGIRGENRSTTMVKAGSLAEGIAGIGAVVLTIIALAGIDPGLLLPIATIVVGAALLFEGGAITARFSSLLSAATSGRADVRDLGLGMTTEFLSGIVGVILGILALIGIAPLILVPVAAIVFGGGLILGTGVTARLNTQWVSANEDREMVREVTNEAMYAAAGVQFLIGLAAVVLGLLALIGMNPLVLSLVAILTIGFADLLTGTATVSRVTSVFRRRQEV